MFDLFKKNSDMCFCDNFLVYSSCQIISLLQKFLIAKISIFKSTFQVKKLFIYQNQDAQKYNHYQSDKVMEAEKQQKSSEIVKEKTRRITRQKRTEKKKRETKARNVSEKRKMQQKLDKESSSEKSAQMVEENVKLDQILPNFFKHPSTNSMQQEDSLQNPKDKKQQKKLPRRISTESSSAEQRSVSRDSIFDGKGHEKMEPEKVEKMVGQLSSSYEGYIEALAFLQNPENKNNLKNQIQSQTNYLRLVECPICCQPYNDVDRKPMNVCTNSKAHLLCSKCLESEPNVKQSSRCYVCRTAIKNEDIKEEANIIAWLKLNNKLGIQFPPAFGLIPEELHQSLRKIAFHEFCQHESTRLLLRRDEIMQKTLKYSILNKELAILKAEKQNELQELAKKVVQQQENYQAFKKQTEQVRNLGKIYATTSQIDIWKDLDWLRKRMDPAIHLLESVDFQLQEVFSELIAHEKLVHASKTFYRKAKHHLYRPDPWGRQVSAFVDQPTAKCAQCEHIIGKVKPKLLELEKERFKGAMKIQECFTNYGYWFVKMIHTFLPKNIEDFNELKIHRTSFLDSKEEKILRKVYENNFATKMDPAQFSKMITSKSQQEKQPVTEKKENNRKE